MKEIKHEQFASVQEALPYLNEVRKQYYTSAILYLLIAVALVLVSFLLFILGVALFEGRFFLFFLLLALFILLLFPVIFYLKAKKLTKRYQLVVYGTLLLFYTMKTYDNFAFIYHVDQDMVTRDCKMKNIKIESENAISHYKGNIRKVNFTSFVYQDEKTKKILLGNKKYNQPHGRFICFQRPIISPVEVLILHKKDMESFAIDKTLLHHVDIADDAFKNDYVILADHEKQALDVITKELLASIQKLNKELSCRISIQVKDQKWFVYLSDLHQKFYLKLNKELVIESCPFIEEQFSLINKIYQELGLDYGN